MKTIVMVKVGAASFVERDERILASQFHLKVFQFGTRSWSFLWSALKFLVWIAQNGRSAELFFTRFAHYHAFLLALAGRLMRREVAVVIGGSDAIWIPKYHYGVYDHWLSRRTTRAALRWASLLLPVHESLVQGINTYSDERPRREGLLQYNPDLRTPIRVVHNGYDADFWKPLEEVQKIPCVLGVAVATDWTVFKTKGIDYFFDTAKRLPEYRFVLVGTDKKAAEDFYGSELPRNLTIYPPMSADQLRAIYSSATVFAHFTLTEGMPNVLCESMLCECVPVGANVNSIPYIIGDAGFIVYARDVGEMASKVELAMKSGLGPRARQRIHELFPLARRTRELILALRELADKEV